MRTIRSLVLSFLMALEFRPNLEPLYSQTLLTQDFDLLVIIQTFQSNCILHLTQVPRCGLQAHINCQIFLMKSSIVIAFVSTVRHHHLALFLLGPRLRVP
jgi:hypothetical protein